jgi:CRISPR-associated protein Cmr1
VRKVNLPSLPNWQAPKKRETIELELRLITPMFGGGYKAREVDPLQPIRPAAIRGHLRFWWRATAGARYASVEELHKAERELWGAAATKDNPAVGKVAIRVEVKDKGQMVGYGSRGGLPKYFLFPFRPQKNIPATKGCENVVFTLRLILDTSLSEAQRAEVTTALKAWIAFGGVGARTRRGCGALTVVSNNANQWLPRLQGIAEWLGMPPNVASKCDWTTLAGAHGQITHANDAEDAWRKLGSFWERFRRGGLVSGTKWSDYRDVLCNLDDQHDELALAKPFLGLPIEYQEFGEQTPFTGTLEPAQSGRMASPVILKPIALQGGEFGALVLVMHAPKPDKIRVNSEEYALAAPTKDPVLQALGANDVLDAVLKGAKQHFGQRSVSFDL